MATPGTKPKPEDRKLGHTPLTTEWTQVPNRPYRGRDKPRLPASRTVLVDGEPKAVKLHELTRRWWAAVSSMPHCSLWTATDWRFALETALIADMLHQGDRGAGAELRLRAKVLGMTFDARRDLRIRYVDPRAAAESSPEGPQRGPRPITDIDDRRRRILGE